MSDVRTALARLRKLESEATPGRWFAWLSAAGKWTVQVAPGWLFEISAKGTKEDAALAVAARNALPILLEIAEVASEAAALLADLDDEPANNVGSALREALAKLAGEGT